MTERPMKGSRSAGRFAWLWMLLAVLAVGGFLGWLGVNSQAISVAVVEEEVEPEVDYSDAEVVTLDDLAADIEAYYGRALRLEDLEVTSRLGDHAFWALDSQGIPFLVKFEKELVEGGLSVSDGDQLTVIGQIREVTAFVLDGWELDGILQSDEDRMLAEFATDYLDVVMVVPADDESADDD